MPTINKPIALKIIAANGYYMGDPRVTAVVSYTNKFNGERAYAITYAPQTTVGYFSSPSCIDPKLEWHCYDSIFYATFSPSSSLSGAYMAIPALTNLEAKLIFESIYPEDMLDRVFSGDALSHGILRNRYAVEFGYMPESATK